MNSSSHDNSNDRYNPDITPIEPQYNPNRMIVMMAFFEGICSLRFPGLFCPADGLRGPETKCPQPWKFWHSLKHGKSMNSFINRLMKREAFPPGVPFALRTTPQLYKYPRMFVAGV